MYGMEKRYNLGILEALFKDTLITENCTANTRKNYLSDVRHFLYWFQWFHSSSLPDENDGLAFFVSTFSHDDVQQYLVYLRQKETPVRSINRKLSSLRRFAAFCQSRGFVSHNSADNIENLPICAQELNGKENDDLNCVLTYENSILPLELQNSLEKELVEICEETFQEIISLRQK